MVPVLVTAALLAHSGEIALYEHGTFKPQLTVDMAERMVKNPGFFEVKNFASARGARRQALDSLMRELGAPQRTGANQQGGSVLAVVGNLVSRARRLDRFTHKTTGLSPRTAAARDALLAAVEPDELLFVSLPEALGFQEIDPGGEYSDADAYAAAMAAAMADLEAASERLLADSLDLLLVSGGGANRAEVVERAASIDADVLDADSRPFVLALGNDGVDDDLDWVKIIATVVAKKSPAEWKDDDKHRFFRELPERMAAFERLVALHSQADAGNGASIGGPRRLRITFTRADGREDARLVSLDDEKKDDLSDALDRVIAEAERLVGAGEQARHALLALMGEQLLEGAEHG